MVPYITYNMWVAVVNSAVKICVKCYEILVKKQLTWKGGEGGKNNRGEKMTLLLGLKEGEVQQETEREREKIG